MATTNQGVTTTPQYPVTINSSKLSQGQYVFDFLKFDLVALFAEIQIGGKNKTISEKEIGILAKSMPEIMEMQKNASDGKGLLTNTELADNLSTDKKKVKEDLNSYRVNLFFELYMNALQNCSEASIYSKQAKSFAKNYSNDKSLALDGFKFATGALFNFGNMFSILILPITLPVAAVALTYSGIILMKGLFYKGTLKKTLTEQNVKKIKKEVSNEEFAVMEILDIAKAGEQASAQGQPAPQTPMTVNEIKNISAATRKSHTLIKDAIDNYKNDADMVK